MSVWHVLINSLKLAFCLTWETESNQTIETIEKILELGLTWVLYLNNQYN